MLLELNIKNIALIEQLRVEFSPGFNVLTGETGAGKSIVVDSVNLALGGRADRELIRNGTERAMVQAVFDVSGNERLRSLLDELGLVAEDGLLTVARELSSSGRNLCRVSGCVVPLNQLKQITALLVDVHGQHEHQSLLVPARHLGYLDVSGDETHQALRAQVRAQYELYAQLTRQVAELTGSKMERERQADMYRFQLDEIEKARVKPGEDEKLERQNRLMENAEKIASSVQTAYQLVYQGRERAPSAQESLKRAFDAMSGISGLDERFGMLSGRLEELYYASQDVGYELQDLSEGLDYDPVQGERVAARLDVLNRLKRKYGPELSDVIAFREQVRTQLEQIEDGDGRLEALGKQLAACVAEMKRLSGELSDSRKRLAVSFTRNMLDQLGDLGMARVRFQVCFEGSPDEERDFSPRGTDRVEFLISPNPGEPVKPLSQIASGGELSRIMLALKAIAADREDVDTMIFDEIDTGISGRMAQVVGEKMAAIAKSRQVICVTHLPQIAALGDAHYLVEKQVVGERTDSTVRSLTREGRIQELARMVGGAEDTKTGHQHAESMLLSAQKLVQALRR